MKTGIVIFVLFVLFLVYLGCSWLGIDVSVSQFTPTATATTTPEPYKLTPEDETNSSEICSKAVNAVYGKNHPGWQTSYDVCLEQVQASIIRHVGMLPSNEGKVSESYLVAHQITLKWGGNDVCRESIQTAIKEVREGK